MFFGLSVACTSRAWQSTAAKGRRRAADAQPWPRRAARRGHGALRTRPCSSRRTQQADRDTAGNLSARRGSRSPKKRTVRRHPPTPAITPPDLRAKRASRPGPPQVAERRPRHVIQDHGRPDALAPAGTTRSTAGNRNLLPAGPSPQPDSRIRPPRRTTTAQPASVSGRVWARNRKPAPGSVTDAPSARDPSTSAVRTSQSVLWRMAAQ